MSINRLIDQNVKCTLCGTKGVGNCDCWVRCKKCRCFYEKNTKCRRRENPNEPMGVIATGKMKLP